MHYIEVITSKKKSSLFQHYKNAEILHSTSKYEAFHNKRDHFVGSISFHFLMYYCKGLNYPSNETMQASICQPSLTLCSFKVHRRQQLKKQKAEKNKFEKKNNFVTILPFFSATKIHIELREGSLKRKIYTLQGGITAISVMTKWSFLFAIGNEKTFHKCSYDFGFQLWF